MCPVFYHIAADVALHGCGDATMASVSIGNDGVPQHCDPSSCDLNKAVTTTTSGYQNSEASKKKLKDRPLHHKSLKNPSLSTASLQLFHPEHQVVHDWRLGTFLWRHATALLVLLAIMKELCTEELIHLVKKAMVNCWWVGYC